MSRTEHPRAALPRRSAAHDDPAALLDPAPAPTGATRAAVPVGRGVLGGRDVLALQRVAGNRAVAASIQREMVEEPGPGPGAAPSEPVEHEAVAATPAPVAVNEFGEIDVAIVSQSVPRLFKNKGKHGNALVNWAGGPGGAGEQPVGSIALVAPVYDSAAPAKAGKPATAWIRKGSGTAVVTRSYKGVQKGANATFYFTSRACGRADRHERLHVSSSKSIHDATIKPLEKRVAKHRGKGSALASGATAADAVTALQTLVDWNTAVTKFAADDSAANTPMGTTDTTDMARADFIRNYGPRTVKGVNYASYIDTPPGP